MISHASHVVILKTVSMTETTIAVSLANILLTVW